MSKAKLLTEFVFEKVTFKIIWRANLTLRLTSKFDVSIEGKQLVVSGPYDFI